MIDKVRSERTLGIAWEKVRRNAGACGVDRISVEFFGKDSENRLLAVKEQLTDNNYIPSAIRRVRIPKPGSAETRPLGIPTVKDRVVQSAVKLVIEPIFESHFAPSSYGFRPGRSCHDALREVERQLKAGRHHIVDVDIKGYLLPSGRTPSGHVAFASVHVAPLHCPLLANICLDPSQAKQRRRKRPRQRPLQVAELLL